MPLIVVNLYVICDERRGISRKTLKVKVQRISCFPLEHDSISQIAMKLSGLVYRHVYLAGNWLTLPRSRVRQVVNYLTGLNLATFKSQEFTAKGKVYNPRIWAVVLGDRT